VKCAVLTAAPSQSQVFFSREGIIDDQTEHPLKQSRLEWDSRLAPEIALASGAPVSLIAKGLRS